MNGRRVVALLDPPASLRFRAVPYLVAQRDRYLVCGWPDLKGVERSATEVDELYQAGYALRLDEPFVLPDGFTGRLGWLGAEFLQQAQGAGCVPCEVEIVDLVEVGDRGQVWVPVGEDGVRHSIEQWLHEAAAKVFRAPVEQRRTLAFLMKRCDPHHALTRAAVWWALDKSDEEQAKHLAWIERLERDRGCGEEHTVDRQRQRYPQVCSSYTTPPPTKRRARLVQRGEAAGVAWPGTPLARPSNGDARRRTAPGQSRVVIEGHDR